MEYIIIAFAICFIIVAFLKTIEVGIGIAVILVFAYSYITYEDSSGTSNIDHSERQDNYTPKEALPILYNDLEKHLTEGKDIKVEVHHYIHNNNSKQENGYAQSNLNLQRVNNSFSSDQIMEIEGEPSYCDKLIIKGKRYVLIEGLYQTEQEAADRIAVLKNSQIKGVKTIWLPCYNSEYQNAAFAIVLGKPCKDEASIKKNQGDYIFDLYSANIALQNPIILLLDGMEIEINLNESGLVI